MMSMWHLVWIVPVVGTIGYFVAACMTIAKRADEQSKRWAMRTHCHNNSTITNYKDSSDK